MSLQDCLVHRLRSLYSLLKVEVICFKTSIWDLPKREQLLHDSGTIETFSTSLENLILILPKIDLQHSLMVQTHWIHRWTSSCRITFIFYGKQEIRPRSAWWIWHGELPDQPLYLNLHYRDSTPTLCKLGLASATQPPRETVRQCWTNMNQDSVTALRM